MNVNGLVFLLALSMDVKASALRTPLLKDGSLRAATSWPTAVRPTAAARWRLCVAAAYATSKAEQRATSDPGRPSLEAARAYAHFFLPKTVNGKLLPLRCTEAEFTAHVGNGVSIYMQFVKATGYMFAMATLIALPQFYANMRGRVLELEWPWGSSPACNYDTSLRGLVGRVMATVSFCFYSLVLGNVSFDATHGLLHLCSELLLCIMFCIYVYLIYWQNRQGLKSLEAKAVRASDFAVKVSRLPARGVDPRAVKAHFEFFGPVSSVGLSMDNDELLRQLQRQRGRKAAWRRQLLEYAHALRVLHTAEAQADATGVQRRVARRECERLLECIERQWAELLRGREQLCTIAAAPTLCTGHAVVVFRRMEHAERCVRHFELIRRHERSRDGYGGASVDFRQLYFRTSHKLEVARAPEPSDIIWANLRYSRLHARTQNFKTSLIIFLVSCVSTIFITAATLVSNMYSRGLVTSLWSTPVIILSNVAIFVLVPLLAVHLEREHTRSSQQLHMLIKMVFFQLFNTVIATLSFLFMHWNEPPADTPSCPLAEHLTLARDEPCFTTSLTMPIFDPRCVKHWYTSGALVLFNVVVGDCVAILGIIDFVRPDKLIIRYLIAPNAPTQAEMNQIFALDSETYLPFRYQLVLKVVCITFIFSPAIPQLLPIAAVFMYASYWVDRYNLLRVFKPPPRTTDRTVTMSVLYILPLAVFGHLLSAIFFYSKQTRQDVPLVYYLVLTFLALLVMVRINGELSMQSQRPVLQATSEDLEARAITASAPRAAAIASL